MEEGEEKAGVESSKRLGSGRIVGNYATLLNTSKSKRAIGRKARQKEAKAGNVGTNFSVECVFPTRFIFILSWIIMCRRCKFSNRLKVGASCKRPPLVN